VEQFTYLGLLLGWALPVLTLHWLVGAPELRRHARVLIPAIVLPTLYLASADAIAISAGAWHISERLTLGLRWRGLVFEEALFFLLTNVMVAQSVVLFLEPEPRARVWRWLSGWRRKR
jgi:lycopene cyclase domain-containing protein